MSLFKYCKCHKEGLRYQTVVIINITANVCINMCGLVKCSPKTYTVGS